MSAVAPPAAPRRPGGTFLALWLSQALSQVGSMLTAFALGVWVFRKTGSVTQYSVVVTLALLPALLCAPVAGVLVDRWGSRRAMFLGDAGCMLASLSLALAFLRGEPAMLHLCLAVAFSSLCEGLRAPAYSAAVPRLVPREQLTRAAGLVQLGAAVADVVAPLLAGVLLLAIGYRGIVLLDVITFLFAVCTVAAVRVPAPASPAVRGSLGREILDGWRYVRGRRGLPLLLGYFALVNLIVASGFLLLTPFVLSFGSSAQLGLVLAVGGAGTVIGGLTMSAWGGPRDRMLGVLGFSPLLGIGLVIAGVSRSPSLAMAGVFALCFAVPMINAGNQAIWQSKVAPAMHGRAFSLSRMVGQSTAPLSYLLAGPLVDRIFEPLLAPGGLLAGGPVGILFGVGRGRGIGLFLAFNGLLLLSAVAAAALSRGLRRLDLDLPDAPRENFLPAPP